MPRHADPVGGLWSARRRFCGPLLGYLVGVELLWALWGGGWWAVAAGVAWVLTVIALAWWWLAGLKADRIAKTLYHLADKSFGVVMKHRVQVVIKPSEEKPGEVIVDVPDGGDGDEAPGVRES